MAGVLLNLFRQPNVEKVSKNFPWRLLQFFRTCGIKNATWPEQPAPPLLT